jgi:hypothetical protein
VAPFVRQGRFRPLRMAATIAIFGLAAAALVFALGRSPMRRAIRALAEEDERRDPADPP